MPVSDAREHLGEVVGRARYAGQETILTHYGAPAAVVISFEEYQRLKHARDDSGDYQFPAEIAAQVSEGRQHPERRSPGPPGSPRAAVMASGRVRPAAAAGLRQPGQGRGGSLTGRGR